jgi:hypothetical protein
VLIAGTVVGLFRKFIVIVGGVTAAKPYNKLWMLT